MSITDSQKKVLAKLKYRDPDKYAERLASLRINESEIQEYITKEASRIATVDRIKKAVFNIPVTIYKKPSSYYPKRFVSNKPSPKKIYLLIDGDNHAIKNMDGYEKAKKMPNVDILVLVANDTLAYRYQNEFGVDVKKVSPGNQAVDNGIMSIAGNKLKNQEYDKLVIISGDKDYQRNIKKWTQKYRLQQGQIQQCKNIRSALK